MRLAVAAVLMVVCAACASSPTFHDGPSGMSGREQRALLSASRARADGFERFWLRPDCRLGLVKWSDRRSHSAKEAPTALLDLIRDEIGRVNRVAVEGEMVFVSVIVFRWQRRFFGRPPRVGYEVIGRDRAGQVVWLALDWLIAPRERAVNLAESDELLVAREVGRKLRKELGR